MLSSLVSLCLFTLKHACKQRNKSARYGDSLLYLLSYRSLHEYITSWVKKVINSFSPSFVPAVP